MVKETKRVLPKTKIKRIYRPRRTEEELREIVLKTGILLFAKKGFAELTVRDISEKSKVPLPSIYRLFVDKRDIYVQCCKRSIQNIVAAINGLRNTSNSSDVAFYKFMLFVAEAKRKNIPEYVLRRRVILDKDDTIIKGEINNWRNSSMFRDILDVCHRGSGGENPLLRFFILDSALEHIPRTFEEWPKTFSPELRRLSNIDKFLVNTLSVLLPGIDWVDVSRRAIETE